MGRFSASASRRDAARRVAILSGALLALPVLPAMAQTMVMGGPTGPDVIVNENVIDSLGPPPTLPGLMRQENVQGVSPSGLRPFTLHPPRAHHRAAAVSKRRSPAEDQVATAPATTAEPAASTSPLRTAIPLGKSPRTSRSKTRSVTHAADTTAIAPPKATTTRKGRSPRQPVQSASAAPSAPAPAAPASAAASPSSPINSIVRRYPAGTGAAMLAASQPPQSSPPAPPPPQPTTPPTQTAAAPPVAGTPAPSAATSGPGPAATVAPTPSPAPAVPASAPSTQAAAATTPAAAAATQPAPPVSAPPQVAALSPSGGPPALPAQVLFAPNVSDTPDQAKSTLDKVVAAMKADDHIHVQLVAYASGLPDQASQARRISLQRAISVRSYLMEQGVKSTRIDVRALGNRTDVPGPQDRVDVVVTDR